ncbi:MAG: ABC transporter substrate-binding protein, partial [Paracoccus sp. (in: a-proteobacteria)]|nr:ABC transporter substrate-binding protein [Paracoccus sp. (in: a-proteobacteria)]
VDAAVNFWHFMAKMRAAGMRDLISVAEASEALGLDPATPLLGYVLRESWIEANPELARGLVAASRAVKERLGEDDSAWESLRPIMNAESDAEFEALREGWRAGIPEDAPVDEAQIAATYALMAELGGEDLTGGVTELPAGLFWRP